MVLITPNFLEKLEMLPDSNIKVDLTGRLKTLITDKNIPKFSVMTAN